MVRTISTRKRIEDCKAVFCTKEALIGELNRSQTLLFFKRSINWYSPLGNKPGWVWYLVIIRVWGKHIHPGWGCIYQANHECTNLLHEGFIIFILVSITLNCRFKSYTQHHNWNRLPKCTSDTINIMILPCVVGEQRIWEHILKEHESVLLHQR